jgi:tetratricopeptide (TPR) repeat protein
VNPAPLAVAVAVWAFSAAAQSPAPVDVLAPARTLLEQGRLPEAEQAVRSVLGGPTAPSTATTAEAHFLLGHILFREVQARAPLESQGGHSELAHAGAKASLAEYAAGAKLRPPGTLDLKIAAFDQVLLGDFIAADGLLTRSLAADPSDAEAWYYLGRTKYNESRFAEAVEAFQQCLKREERSVRAADNLGLAYAGLGRTEEALAAYQQAIAWQAERPEKSPGPYLDLGSLLLDQNRAKDALPALQQAAALAPRHPRVHEQLGKAYLQLEQLAEAQASLERAVELAPESAPLHFMLGQVYRRNGLMDKAKSELATAASLNGSHSTASAGSPSPR